MLVDLRVQAADAQAAERTATTAHPAIDWRINLNKGLADGTQSVLATLWTHSLGANADDTCPKTRPQAARFISTRVLYRASPFQCRRRFLAKSAGRGYIQGPQGGFRSRRLGLVESMASILITAFEPYDQWVENSSWLALVDFTRNMKASQKITTRLYPVNFEEVRQRLQKDLASNYDYVLHLGQAPGLGAIRLEAIGVNVGGSSHEPPEQYRKLVDDGPVAYHSALPLADWVGQLREAGVPASVSFHAGTLLCNATLYMTHYFVQKMSLQTEATFVHLPLATRQVAIRNKEMASLPVATSAAALHLIVAAIAKLEPQYDPKLV